MNKKIPISLTLQFNECINNQDIDGLTSLMTEDHTFIDRANEVTKGKDVMTRGWIEFFNTFPDYKNTFTRIESQDNVVFVLGFAYWSEKEKYDPVIWKATIVHDLIAEWRIYEDTEENRKKCNLT